MSDSDDDFQPDPRSRLKSVKKPAAATLQSVPVGHCLMNPKWKNTITGQNISKLFSSVKYVEDLGVMDCQLGAHLYSVVLVSCCFNHASLIIMLFLHFSWRGT